MDYYLKCNILSCRAELRERAVVTTCRCVPLFCVQTQCTNCLSASRLGNDSLRGVVRSSKLLPPPAISSAFAVPTRPASFPHGQESNDAVPPAKFPSLTQTMLSTRASIPLRITSRAFSVGWILTPSLSVPLGHWLSMPISRRRKCTIF